MCFSGKCPNESYSGDCSLSWAAMLAYHASVEESEPKEVCPTKYAPDVASAASAEPLSGLESVSAVESDTQPRG